MLTPAALLLLIGVPGCLVPQPRGDGELRRIVEPTSNRGYQLYLPKTYVAADEAGLRARRWPLVVSFHGMKPFDNAHSQALEWEQEADRYGFVVVAPELRAPDVLQQFPLRTAHPAFKSDEDATVAILHHVFATTHADRSNILATSWSSGGYMAHYMLNQHPELFTCLAVRQSNCAVSVLDPDMAPLSRYHPILVVTTQHDFAGCKKESREAIQWYEQHGFANDGWIEIKALGHERTPDMAADFFARVAGVRPSRSPTALARRQAIDGNPEGLAFFSGQPVFQTSPAVARAEPNPLPETPARPRRRPPVRRDARAAPAPVVRSISSGRPTPNRAAPARSREASDPVSIRVSSVLGIEPLYLSFSAECPSDWQRTATFLWTINGDPVCRGVNGQKTVARPGEHTLGLLVVTRDGREFRASRDVRVIPRLDASSLPPAGGH